MYSSRWWVNTNVIAIWKILHTIENVSEYFNNINLTHKAAMQLHGHFTIRADLLDCVIHLRPSSTLSFTVIKWTLLPFKWEGLFQVATSLKILWYRLTSPSVKDRYFYPLFLTQVLTGQWSWLLMSIPFPIETSLLFMHLQQALESHLIPSLLHFTVYRFIYNYLLVILHTFTLFCSYYCMFKFTVFQISRNIILYLLWFTSPTNSVCIETSGKIKLKKKLNIVRDIDRADVCHREGN